MGNAMRYLNLVLLIAVFGALSTSIPAEASNGQEEILVGRIAHVEGKLLRYIEEDKDWVLTVRDSPFGLEDALYSGEDAKAEFIMPNRTWLRVGENTQIQLIDLNPEATTVDVASGLARLYNKSANAVIKVTTPFGYVVAPGDTVFDLYVGDESIEVIAVRGKVDFVHEGTTARYEVLEGSFSIIADAAAAARGNGAVDADWDDWNKGRDDIWLERLQRSDYSARFLPEPIRDEAYVLEEHGQWERVYYEGADRDMWRPSRVDRGWRPFTAGRWTVYYGDNCWIPDEDFGYVTHHYGSWVYVASLHAWYWIPPSTGYDSGASEIVISFGWYPGRVGWIHSGSSIGWVPLAPNEEYYGYRSWGHRTVVVDRTTTIDIAIVRYRFLDEAVIIDRDHFYRGSRYTPYVQRNVSRDVIVNNYQSTTVINNTVINNFNTDKRRFAYNDLEASRKPHATVMRRISDNQKSSRSGGRVNRQRIEQDLTRVNARPEPVARPDIRRPMRATRLVDADQISKPIETLSLQKKEIKPKKRERQISTDKEQRRRPPEQEKIDRTGDTSNQDGQRRIKSPRESRGEEQERAIRPPDQVRRPGEKQRSQEQTIRRPKQEEGQDRQELQRRDAKELQEHQEQQQRSPEQLRGRKPQERPAVERQKVQKPAQMDSKPSIKSPREKRDREVEQQADQQGTARQRQEDQIQKEQKIKRQSQEQDQNRQELQRRDAKELQERQEQQQRSPEQLRGRKPQERPAVERQKVQKPAQMDNKPSIKSPREKRDREVERQAEQQGQARQRELQKRREQQEADQRLQKQELQKQQQKAIQRRQEPERQRPQQEGKQVRPKQEKQRQQQEGAPGPEDPQQSLKEKKRTPQEQEEWEQQQKEEWERQHKGKKQEEKRPQKN